MKTNINIKQGDDMEFKYGDKVSINNTELNINSKGNYRNLYGWIYDTLKAPEYGVVIDSLRRGVKIHASNLTYRKKQ
jgi:hypothetical protein